MVIVVLARNLLGIPGTGGGDMKGLAHAEYTNWALDLRKFTPILLTLLVAAAYVVAFFGFYHLIGIGVGALATIPLVAAGWFLGLRGGILAGVFSLPLNAILYSLVGLPGWEGIFQAGATAGWAALVVVGAAVGRLSDLQELGQRRRWPPRCLGAP